MIGAAYLMRSTQLASFETTATAPFSPNAMRRGAPPVVTGVAENVFGAVSAMMNTVPVSEDAT